MGKISHSRARSSYVHYLYLCRNKSGGSRACCISTAAVAFCLVIYSGISYLQQEENVIVQQLQQQQVGVVGGPEVREHLTQAAEELRTGLGKEVVKGGSTSKNKYVVETSTCKIPEMDPRDSSVLNFLKPDFWYPVDCKGTHKAWAFVDGKKLIVNQSAVHDSGYSMSSIYCCYRIIQRVEQPWSDFDVNADNYVKYSDKCYPIHNEGVEIDTEFIRVHCISKLPPLYNDVVYRDFFAVAQPGSDRLVAKKLSEWKLKNAIQQSNKSASAISTPPNVVIIGIDNNSRMNSHRHLKKTLQVLRSVGAVEMLGYTKVGENTYPNTVPFLSGYSAKELETICYKSHLDPFDNCPYIWKAFDSVNYLTVHVEDSPYLAGFNYLRTGFVKKPTDFYFRPLMLALMTYLPRWDYYHTDCVGRYMTDEFAFNYLLDIIRIATAHSTPVFVHNWLTSLAHHSYNNLQFGDDSISHYIQSLVNISNDNTIFFFMSDHGQRYGPIRETTQGWYEDKLPTQWVYIPAHIKAQFPEWDANLKLNAGRLTSHFDVYQTMLHILKTFSGDVPSDSNNQFPNATKPHYGLSLFNPIPENRTCEEAGVTVNFCACSKPKPLDINDAKVWEATVASVKHLASLVPLDVCAEPTLKNVVTAGFLDLPGKPVYVITFVTEPGDFLFEVNVEMDELTGQFVITTDLLRMNKITRPASCVKESLLERYCYCK